MKYLLLLLLAIGCQKQPARPFAITTVEAIESRPAMPPEPAKVTPLVEAGRDFRKSCCRITVMDGQFVRGYASGVLVDGGVLTAEHIRRDNVDLIYLVVECDGEVYKCPKPAIRSSYWDSRLDLMWFPVKWQKPHTEAVLAKDNPSVGDALTGVGRLPTSEKEFDTKLESQLYKVREDVHPSGEIWVTPQFTPGQSGGGLFNSGGELVGVINSHTPFPAAGVAKSLADINKLLARRAIPLNPRRAIIGTATWCGTCKPFRDLNGNGNATVVLRYVDIDKPKQIDVTQEEYDRVIATARGMYGPNVEQQLPLAMWHADNGKWYSKNVAGWKMAELERWVR